MDNCVKYDIVGYFINPCNDELVTISGTFTDCFSESINPAGKNKYHIHSLFQGTGTGEFGNQYVFIDVGDEVYQVNPGETLEANYEESFKFISKGSAPNFIVKVVYHVTITPNGDLRVYRDYISEKCVG